MVRLMAIAATQVDHPVSPNSYRNICMLSETQDFDGSRQPDIV